MAVSDSFREFVLEQLGCARRDIQSKRMFGGIGLYAGDLFFALIDDDLLYFKVDDRTRPQFLKAKSEPFRPGGDGAPSLQYYRVPISVLEDPDELTQWVRDAVEVAQRALHQKKPSPARSTRRT